MRKSIALLSLVAVTAFFTDVRQVEAALPETASLPQSGSIVSRWKLDEASGTRADSVGSNDLTDNNTVLSGTGNNSDTAADFEFDNSEFLSRADNASLSITSDLSYFVWINLESTASNIPFMSKQNSADGERSYQFRTNNDTLWWVVYANGTSGAHKTVAWTRVTDVWVHLGIVYDASAGSVSFWVDGEQQGTTQTGLDTSIADTVAAFRIGRDQGDGANYFDGLMEDAIIWNVALASPEDVYAAYSAAPESPAIFFITYSDHRVYA